MCIGLQKRGQQPTQKREQWPTQKREQRPTQKREQWPTQKIEQHPTQKREQRPTQKREDQQRNFITASISIFSCIECTYAKLYSLNTKIIGSYEYK